ncbi:XRE family transcriptional regulator [Salicibibacter halophilus]|uniref:XRE family transcriptional regulator n=1 Tax=Salicibibacter halophilus TaxID=2502791 RepID=A0A514LL08_9BACI|nr:helix-turn-helix transcriptional regulator [Salicibibacter halophilus]QDI92483.1 XRE family transcriptional regulator [Salicibibacter halophilus]
MPTLGERIKQIRKEENISQQKLANVLKITPRQLRRYENNEFEPNLETLKSLADYFNISLDYLVGRSNNRKN